jgi:hypothetical protein
MTAAGSVLRVYSFLVPNITCNFNLESFVWSCYLSAVQATQVVQVVAMTCEAAGHHTSEPLEPQASRA